jgi:uncharacterized cupin superfamily protein
MINAIGSFRRIGSPPGARPMLADSGWRPTRVPKSQGMTPQSRDYYKDRSGKVRSGVWACNAGTIEIRDNPAEEVCFVVSGTVRVTDCTGRSETFGTGECLALPRGFSGLWAQSDDFAIVYVAVEGA